MLECSFKKVEFYLFKSATLFLLFFDAFLSVMQQLPLVLLGVPALSCQLGLLPLVSLRALFVLLLQTLEVPPQGGLTRHIEDWTEDQKSRYEWKEELKQVKKCPVTEMLKLPWLSVISTIVLLFITTTVLVLCFFCKEKLIQVTLMWIFFADCLWTLYKAGATLAYPSLPFFCVYGQYGLWVEFGPGVPWADPWWRNAWAAAPWMAGWDMSLQGSSL